MTNKEAYFEATNLHVPLPDGWFYHDEGKAIYESLPQTEKPQFFTIEDRLKSLKRDYVERAYSAGILSREQRISEIISIESEGLRLLEKSQKGRLNGITLMIETPNVKGEEEVNIHVLYLRTEDPVFNLYSRAHEEAHAISLIPGGNGLLSEKIAQDRKYKNPWSIENIADKEVAADYSALHVLSMANTSKKLVQGLVKEGKREELSKAWELYQQGDKKILQIINYFRALI